MGLEVIFAVMFWTSVLYWIGQNVVIDGMYAARGKVSPRRQERLARVKRGEAPERYGFTGWFTDLKEDALRANTAKRRKTARQKAREKAKQAAEARQQQAEESPVDDMVDAVGVRGGTRPPGSKPSPHPRPNAPIPDAPTLKTVPIQPDRTNGSVPARPVDDPVQRVADELAARRAKNGGAGLTKCEHCATDVLVGGLHPRTIDGKQKRVCAHCAGLIKVDASTLVPVPNGQPVNGNGQVFALAEDGKTAQSVPSPNGSTNGLAERRSSPNGSQPTSLAVNPDEAAWKRYWTTYDLYGHGPECERCNQHIREVNGRLVCWCTESADKAVPPPAESEPADGHPTVDLDQVRRDMASGIGQCLGCGELKPLVAKYWAVGGEVCADCAGKADPKDLRPLDEDTPNDHPTNTDGIVPSPTEGTNMPTPSGETTRILSTRNFLNELEQHVMTEILPQIETCAATLASRDMDPEVVARISGLRDRFASAAAEVKAAAGFHDDRTTLMETGVNNTAHAAQTDYYRHA